MAAVRNVFNMVFPFQEWFRVTREMSEIVS